MFMSEINYIAVVVGGILHMIIGFLWYGFLFAKPWMKMVGLTPEKINASKDTMGRTYLVSFILGLIMAGVLYWLVKTVAPFSLTDAAMFGGLLWLGFTANPQLNNNMFLGKPFKLFLIDSGYFLVSMVVLTVLYTLW
jgi:hypothetical protein